MKNSDLSPLRRHLLAGPSLSAPQAKVTGGLAGGAFLGRRQVQLPVSAGAKLVHSLLGVGGARRRPLQGVHGTAQGNVAQPDGVGV